MEAKRQSSAEESIDKACTQNQSPLGSTMDTPLDGRALAHAMEIDLQSIDPIPKNELQSKQKGIIDHIQNKLEKLNLRRNILQLKYEDLKSCNDGLQITVIITSTLLTLLEASKSEVRDEIENGDTGTGHFLAIVPIFMSAGIATIASIHKFKKFQERMEAMIRAIDVCVEVTIILKKNQESVRHSKTLDELIAVKKQYSTTTYNAYCKAQEAVESVIKYQDLVDHLPEFHSMTLQIQQSETNFQNRTLEIDKTHPKITRGWCPYLRFW